jgi:protein-S-isoprenylcysteine O-methyltransferase Ste14
MKNDTPDPAPHDTQGPQSSRASDRANTFPWPPVLFVAALLAAWAMDQAIPITWPGVDDGAARIIGIGFGVAGVILVAWAISALIGGGTTVMPDKASTALITSGPFGYFRNPIYLGEVLILLGLAELTKNVWYIVAAAAFAVLVTILQIVPEERHLEARFGDSYRDYKRRTRRWI